MRATVLVPLAALAVAGLPSLAEASARVGAYSLELVDESGNTLPTFESGGRTFVLGQNGRRYSLRLHNASGERVEFVAAVDGRDVLDGQPSELGKRGYVVDPYGDLVVDGFRLNTDSVAAFRFGSVARSYAARMGDARDVGVIGVAVFPERRVYVPPPRPVYQNDGYGHGCDGCRLKSLSRLEAAPVPPSAAAAPRSSANDLAGAPSGSIGDLAAQGAGGGGLGQRDDRPGLGTEFGEERESHSHAVQFERASSSPAVMLTVRYDDRRGLLAMGVELEPRYESQRDLQLRENAEPFRRDPGFSQPPTGWNAY
jgi:hypothetical protein